MPRNQPMRDPLEDIPLPKKDDEEKVYSITVGNKSYIFNSEEEAKAFIYLIRIKRIYIEDAYDHILKLREEGYFGTGDGENVAQPPFDPYGGY